MLWHEYDTKFKIERDFTRLDTWRVWAIQYNIQSKQCWVAKPIEFEMEIAQEGAHLPPPTLFHPSKALKGLAEGLVDCDEQFRKLLTTDHEIKAVREHLADMRTLLFKNMGVQS